MYKVYTHTCIHLHICICIHIYFCITKSYEDNKSTWVRIHCPIDKLYIYIDITLTPR